MRRPSSNPITLPFGSTQSPYSQSDKHTGVDFGYLPDNRIYAPFSGKVTQVPNNGRDGNGMYMVDDHGRWHGLLHASSYLVPNGSFVQEGQPIAVMGATGAAQGVHCHWCVQENGVFIDPLTLVKEPTMPPVTASPKQIDDTINRTRVLAGFPDKDLETFLQVYRPLLSNNYVDGVMTMLDNLIKDPNSAINKPPEGFVPVGQLYVKEK